MKIHLKQGWRLTIKHFYIIIFLFLYELVWGFFLYRSIDGIMVPLLKRYPGGYGTEGSVQLFLTEAQFRLLKTDLIHPYLWLFAGLLAARMLITPFLNAGLFHSLCYTTDNEGTRFLHGIRAAWKPIALLYVIEMVLALTPGIWLLPRALHTLLNSGNMTELLQMAGPWAGAWLAWAILLHLLFLAMQFGSVYGNGALRSLWSGVRNFLPFAGISIIMWGITALLSMTFVSVSMLWAGLIALILQQSYPFIKTIMKVWTVASQYDVWQSKRT
ncbi:hypothetical protein Back11_45260 [Paenibacillus baekrokdamisoli]|uniref:Uncharacterized protein n=1 Tax=Paenibacillus baekrokdamisoli TaxID=1712516 RepID=A0A3G9JBB8_9BACL|nr:hypothetical protein [Paenibacillus baekrokdamisoli]MBB3072311.1 hypothetical protein [Paenibacillus baekrokdamisoli]BBH23181.1 hypothetical protein Back11_45260 [Paenibacillus baekrokdamisoli]